jgi:CHAT domain-containing protein
MRRFWWLVPVGLAPVTLLAVDACSSSPVDRITELADIVGDHRFIEPRLTGGFAYAGCRTAQSRDRLLPEGSCSDPQAIEKVRPALRDFLSRLDDSEVHTRGVALLLGASDLRGVRAAVQSLEKAEPRDARALNDLAAGYFVLAHQANEPEDLIRALNAVEKACEIDPSLGEANFNRALILDRLRLRGLAVRSWTDLMEAGPRSGWTEEAKRRLQELRQPASGNPQSDREHAFESLGNWGCSVLSGDAGTADRSLRLAGEIGRSLQIDRKDSAVAGMVEAIANSVTAGRSRQLHLLAQGHRALQEGLILFGNLEASKAEVSFRQAASAFQSAGSPAELWALGGLARCLAYAGRYPEAEELFDQVLNRAAGESVPSLTGWARWGMAWSKTRQGQLAEGIGHYRLAEREYVQSGEAENLAAVRTFLGENFYLLGQEATGWRYRYQSLSVLVGLPTSFRRHVLLLEAASAAVNQGFSYAGLALQEEDVRIAEETGNPVIRTEALGARSRILNILGRPDQARRDLEVSWRSARLAPDSAPGKKLVADLLWITGESLRSRNPGAAIGPLSRAIEAYQRQGFPLSAVQALLSRYRIYEGLGSHQKAETDLAAALRMVEESGRSVRDQDLRSSYAEAVQSAYDDMIRLQWQRGDRREALRLLERARAFPGPPQAEPFPAAGQSRQNRVVISYAVLPDRLLGWVLDGNRISTFERKVRSAEIAARVARMVEEVQKGGPELQKVSGSLHDLLIPPAVLDIPEDRTLLFVPDRSLSRVPFTALWNARRGRFLIEDHPVAISPSLSLRAEEPELSKSLVNRPSVLLVGNPTIDRSVLQALPELKHAGEEMVAVRSAFPDSRELSGAEATRRRVLAELGRADVFIFIGHSVANESDPSRSFQVLAPSSDPPDSGLLLNRELGEESFRNLRLVVLSSCSSVGPGTSRTSGLAGLASAFLRKGANAVVGTLFPIEDKNAQKTLERFYRELAMGRPAVMALRAAQRESIEEARAEDAASVSWSAFEAVSR